MLSAIPAIATALLGMFTGALVRNRQSGLTGGKKTLFMFGAALVFVQFDPQFLAQSVNEQKTHVMTGFAVFFSWIS